ncbi:MAG: ribbon-helix-helix protein, CopG family [Proteobacteria bacterium]|nr:ribbon-helix-helix protein, CopG family [Pseudomonadota bacterium]
MLTIRLDKKIEKDIDDMAKHLQISKSDLVRECIAQYIVNFEKPSAWELGTDRFGKYASGKSNLSKDRKALLTEIIQKKRA